MQSRINIIPIEQIDYTASNNGMTWMMKWKILKGSTYGLIEYCPDLSEWTEENQENSQTYNERYEPNTFPNCKSDALSPSYSLLCVTSLEGT
jgi:hypothetical protein